MTGARLGLGPGPLYVRAAALYFPDQVLRAAPIAGTAQNTPHDFLFAEIMCEATMSDPGWNGGEYASSADRRPA